MHISGYYLTRQSYNDSVLTSPKQANIMNQPQICRSVRNKNVLREPVAKLKVQVQRGPRRAALARDTSRVIRRNICI